MNNLTQLELITSKMFVYKSTNENEKWGRFTEIEKTEYIN